MTSGAAQSLPSQFSTKSRLCVGRAEEAARREALFAQSVNAERTRGDALSKRFEEALRQAKDEPVTRPTRGFDLD